MDIKQIFKRHDIGAQSLLYFINGETFDAIFEHRDGEFTTVKALITKIEYCQESGNYTVHCKMDKEDE